jgi:hypothetical protein
MVIVGRFPILKKIPSLFTEGRGGMFKWIVIQDTDQLRLTKQLDTMRLIAVVILP